MNTHGKMAIPRIFHGPENIGGIGRKLADWQRHNKGAQADFIVYTDNTNAQGSHKNLHIEALPPVRRFIKQCGFLARGLKNYDIFHFYFGKTLLPFNLDLPLLKLFRKIIVMNYVGSDVRLNSVELRRNPFFLLRPEMKRQASKLQPLKRLQLRWQALWADVCIAPRNLYAHAREIYPERKIIRDIWTTNTMLLPDQPPSFKTSPLPVVLHAPTNAAKKGTAYINQAVENLKAKGLAFEYLCLTKVPHEEFIQSLRKADIVVNSVLGGGFGNLAMEAMANGKPVCGYVLDEIRALIPDLPVVQCTIETLEEKLAWLIENPQERVRISRAGYDFAREHYDRDKIGEALWALYMGLFRK